MRRRDFLIGGCAAASWGVLRSAFAQKKAKVAWAPYQCLDLESTELARNEDLARIIWFAKEFVPQSFSGRPAYDPQSPEKPGTERPMPGYGKRIHASELSISVPNTYVKAQSIKQGLARLLAADKDHAVRAMLMVGLQFHTTGFDHPTDGICVPPGFKWEWVMTVPHAVADTHRRGWLDAGYQLTATPSVQLAADKVKSRGWPAGWLRIPPGTKTGEQYTILPDLRVRECRKFFLDRLAMINKELGLVNVELSGKSGWLHGDAAVRNRPTHPVTADPWLPSPYPGDSYRDANVALVKEAVARFGAERVTWTNTGAPTPAERAAQGLPEYVSLRDGGIRAAYDQWYGSCATYWSLKVLAEKGAFSNLKA